MKAFLSYRRRGDPCPLEPEIGATPPDVADARVLSSFCPLRGNEFGADLDRSWTTSARR